MLPTFARKLSLYVASVNFYYSHLPGDSMLIPSEGQRKGICSSISWQFSVRPDRSPEALLLMEHGTGTEYSIMALALAINSFSTFAPPVAVNRLLAYVETDGQDALVSPWVWISILFVGPVITSLSFQWYVYYGTTALFRVEALLVQLVFEHSLRIRLKADAEGEDKKKEDRDGGDTESVSEAASVTDVDTDTEVASDADSSHSGAKPKAQGTSGAESTEKKKKENLIGRINTFVTVDVGNVTEAKDFLMLGRSPNDSAEMGIHLTTLQFCKYLCKQSSP